jgi:putative tricarboxylic transport membrane protein
MSRTGRDQAMQLLSRQVWGRKDVLAGLMFMAVAVFGLWASRNYPIGTALRMSTGYVPRLLCWTLLLLGVVIFWLGVRASDERGAFAGVRAWRPLVFVPASLLVFAYTLDRFGVVIATILLVAVGSIANREIRPLEVAASAVVLVLLTLAIFIWGLELPIPVWPER